MSLLPTDPITQMAFSIYENKGVYALLVGSGLSKAAGIPTGWRITLDLIRRVALAQGIEDQTDWAAWYQETHNQEPNYSELVDELGKTADERRSILHSYIEPTSTEQTDGNKIPTDAHRAIAKLAQAGYIRVIVTTNFDRLLETALREQGVEPTIVASVDALKGAEPLTHTACYLLKLHGDYKDARILNTDKELSKYPSKYEKLLDRIIDEHGLIVCGWSGEWDIALREAIMRAPARRYTTYWAARNGKVRDDAKEIINHRKAQVVPIDDADSFFTKLEEKVTTLATTHRQNPMSVDLIVESTKKYIAKPEHRVQLDDLVTSETNALVNKIDRTGFSTSENVSPEEFQKRVLAYESFTEPVAKVAGVLGRWGEGDDFHVVSDIMRSLCTQRDELGSNFLVWLNLRYYPAVLVFSAYGLGLTKAQRWNVLHEFLNSTTAGPTDLQQNRLIERLFLSTWWEARNNQAWQWMPNIAEHKTPLSEHLYRLFAEWGMPFVGSSHGFDYTHGTWEILCSLAYLESISADELEQAWADDRRGFVWQPVGRSIFDHKTQAPILNEVQGDKLKSQLLEAGFSNGDDNLFQNSIKNYRLFANRLLWS